MKHKTMKKLVAAIMAAAMVAGITACGATEKAEETAPKTETAKEETTAAETTETTTEEAPKERQNITVMTLDFYAGQCNVGEEGEKILGMIEDAADVNVEIEWVLNDVAEEKITLAMANPATMPMIMTHSGSLNGQIVSAAKAGAFVNLNDYIWDAEKYPNLSQMNESVASTLSVDGALIAIPRTRDIGRYGLSYRQDWAEKVGITSEPKTVEEVYDMLYKFTYEDPDGNGVDDTFGMEMTSYTGPFDIIQTWFGVGNKWAEVDGKLIPVHMQPEYKEAIDWIKKVYEDGLMPQDWAVRTTDTWSNGCKTGESGAYIDVMDGGRRIWDYYVAEDSYTPSVVNPDEPASMNLLGAVNGKTLATSGYNGFFTLSASTCDTPEKIEAALTFLDKLNENDVRLLAEYGLEGIHWEKDADGNLVDLDVEDAALMSSYAGLNQLVANLPRRDIVPGPAKNERNQAQADVYARNEPCAVFNPAESYLANSATYADVGKTLDELLAQARTQYICGEIDEAGLQKAWDEWASQGGQAIIDEVNEQHAANK